MKKIIVMLTGIMLMQASISLAAINIFNDRAAWLSAIGDYKVETFNSLPLNSDITIQSSTGYLDFTNNVLADTVYTEDFSRINHNTNILFSNYINYFGADWVFPTNYYEGIPFKVLSIYMGNDFIFQPSNLTGDFIGIISNQTFNGVTISTLFYDQSCSYSLDNLAYGSNISSSTVPEPSTFILLCSGLGGLALLRRRAKK
jgi:PEP-CTERM motif